MKLTQLEELTSLDIRKHAKIEKERLDKQYPNERFYVFL